MVSFKDFTRVLAEKAGTTLKDAEAFARIYHECVVDVLNEQERLQIRGFGSYSIVLHKSRMSLNPSTGEDVEVPAHYSPVFRFSQSVKEKIKKAHPIGAPAKKKRTVSSTRKSKKS